MGDTIKNFSKKYRARVEESPYRVNKVKNTGVTFSDREAITDPALDIEYEQMVAIHMPQAQFHALVEHDTWIRKHFGKSIDLIIDQHEHESRVRNENPAVKDAYEKYLTVLSLAQ